MEIFTSTGNSPATVAPWFNMTVHLVVAFIGGLLVAGIYRFTRPQSHVNPSLPPTLVLLAILIAMVTQVIGESVARAFSLVGALSIVRFRTVVRDTQDTAFVIFSVVVGMAIGAAHTDPTMPGVLGYLAGYRIAALGIIVMGAAAMIIKQRTGIGWIERENTLGVRISLGLDAEKLLASHFDKCVADHEVISVSTAKQGAALDYVYRVRMNPGFDPGAFVKELNQIEGVQNVELRRGEPEVA
jgi:hypothetical protein